MATNLILNHGFDGYVFDGKQNNISRANSFFRSKKDCLLYPPVLTHAWITSENVNELLIRSGCTGEVAGASSGGAPPEQDYRSVSLLAMQNLCRKRGYRMIGAHRHGFNVLFLRQDEGINVFPEVSIEEIHDNLWTRWGQTHRWPLVKDMAWQEV